MESLSVVIPAFNAASTLRESIESAFAADASQVVVVDDGSTDSTKTIALEAGAEVLSQPNSGAAAARRLGLAHIRAASGAAVFLDADDTLVAAGVKSAVDLIGEGKFAAVCGRTIGIHADGSETLLKSWSVAVTTQSLLERGYGPCPPASVVWELEHLRRAMSDEIPAIWPRFAEDYELLIRGSLLGPIGVTREASSRYRMTGGKSANSAIRSVKDAERIRAHYADVSGLAVSLRGPRSQQALALIRNASGERRRSRARYLLLLRAFVQNPRTVLSFATQTMQQRRQGL